MHKRPPARDSIVRQSVVLGMGASLIVTIAGCSEKDPQRAPRSTAQPPVSQSGKPVPGAPVFQEHRQRALAFRLGRDAPRIIDAQDVHGLVVDWGIDDQSGATVICMADGSASIYFSSGGGVIGAGEHEGVRRASVAVLRGTVESRRELSLIEKLPPTASGTMRFTLITDGGLLSAEARVTAIKEDNHPLAPLASLVQDLITAIRKAESKNK